ncbi:MAG TPA: cytochrome c3 family protein [Candidatus Acidoferrum sp.]|nr:cytochrome c3 family protein [Candidatus Acidoferrum sp.]
MEREFGVRLSLESGGKIGLVDGALGLCARIFVACLFCGVLFLFSASRLAAQTKNTCLDCHSQLDAPYHVDPAEYSQSIHAQKGITCAGCHGGDPTSSDMDKAMSKAAGFKGRPERKQVPEFCARCHGDAAYMRGFNPSLRTDQYSQYLTSVHGKLLAKGDDKVAVCIDCHGVHDIQPPNDPRARVYPVNVAHTCGACHANADYMKPYKIPTNQLALYDTSVHHKALVEGGDLSAPTCSTCHGSHGAAPPGVSSVVNVCSTCHVFQAELFDSSPHKDAFATLGLPGCVTCHSNHGILHPTDAFIGTSDDAICMKCHSSGDPGYEAADKIHAQLVKLDASITRSREILNTAEQAGVEVGQPKMELDQARDDLTKARVSIHSVSLSKVEENLEAGFKVTEATFKAGQAALGEASYRRRGLALSLIFIFATVLGLYLFIRQLERKPS